MNKQAVMSFASPLAGKFVKRAPLIAGNAPESFDAVSVEILASATVPDAMFEPLRLVRFAPLAAGRVLSLIHI